MKSWGKPSLYSYYSHIFSFGSQSLSPSFEKNHPIHTKQKMELIVDWPSATGSSKTVAFALESSTTYFFYKTKRAKRESWYTRKDQEQFRSNALRDAAFFRALKHSRQGIDPSIYDEKVCFWGLEKAMCRQKAVQSIKNKMALVRAVIEIRALSNVRLDVYTVEEEAADISRQLSKASKRQAYEIALLQEQKAKKIVRTWITSREPILAIWKNVTSCNEMPWIIESEKTYEENNSEAPTNNLYINPWRNPCLSLLL